MSATDPPRSFLSGRLVRPTAGVTIGRALLLGFGAVFALWLVSTYELMRRLADIQARAFEFSTRFTEGAELLLSVRAEVLLGSVQLRDAVLDPAPGGLPLYREELESTRTNIEQALDRYLPDVDSDMERAHWARLDEALTTYWSTLLPVLSGRLSQADAQALLRRDVQAQRAVVDRISDDLLTLTSDAYEQHQAEVEGFYADTRRQMWWSSGMAVVLALIVAWVAAHHVRRLDRLIRRQHLRDVKHKQGLQRLASRLVHAQEEERRSIARDLHDEIGQALTAIRMEMTLLERRLTPSAPSLAEMGSLMDGVIRTIHDLSQLLHPAMLDDFGLPVTLDAYVQRFSRRTGVHARLIAEGMQERLPSALEISIYRIVQEGLNNVAKHAGAAACRVMLRRRDGSVSVTIEDDGVGLAAGDWRQEGGAARGLGLMGIRERAYEFGGSVHLDSEPGGGTRLTVTLPTPRHSGSVTQVPANAGAETVSLLVPVEGDRVDGPPASLAR